jgi:hypothetical protein
MTVVAAALAAMLLIAAPASADDPKLTDLGTEFFPVAVNAGGVVLGALTPQAQPPVNATWANGAFTPFAVPAGATSSTAYRIADTGVAVGYSSFPGGTQGTTWTGGGPSLLAPSIDAPADTKSSTAVSISPNGAHIAGNALTCRANDIPPFDPPTICQSVPALSTGGWTPLVTGLPAGEIGAALDVNDSGVAIGFLTPPLQPSQYVLFSGGAPIPLPIAAKRVFNDGTIIGTTATGHPVTRPPGATDFTDVPCGNATHDGNQAGDILTGHGAKEAIWHDGTCYDLEDVLPDAAAGWKVPANSYASINANGLIATRGTPPGGGAAHGITLVPKYPFAVEISVTPTGKPGEYRFETTVTRGTAGTVVSRWDFGDGTAATGNSVVKRFTKPGSVTVTEKVTNTADGKTFSASASTTITIPAPTLQAGVGVVNHADGKVSVGETVTIDVSVSASDDGVGDLSDLTFQDGTFTANPSGLLAFTTAATSPFAVAPGATSSYPLKVKVTKAGKVKLRTLVIGKDAAGRDVSASATREITAAVAAFPAKGVGVTPKFAALKDPGVAAVALTNTNAFEVTGRTRLVAPPSAFAAARRKPRSVPVSGWAGVRIAAGGRSTVKLKLVRGAKRRIAAGKAVKATLVLELRSPSGQKRTATRVVTLRGAKGGKRAN